MGGATESFVISEEEELVPEDRPAEVAAELVLYQSGLQPSHRLKEANGVEFGVAQEIPRRAMEIVGAAANAGIDDGTRRAPVLGAVVVGVEPEFLNCIRRCLHYLIGETLITGPVGVIVQ